MKRCLITSITAIILTVILMPCAYHYPKLPDDNIKSFRESDYINFCLVKISTYYDIQIILYFP